MTNIAKIVILAGLTGSIMTLSFIRVFGAEKTGPVFEGKTTLLKPDGYREWVFVGSSLGLSYAPQAIQNPNPNAQIYHNVYINPSAYQEFLKTGKFPEGTMMVLETASAEAKNEPGLQGSYEKDYVGLEASVKDRSRFDGGWGYFSFTQRGGPAKAKAEPFPKEMCSSCHRDKAATDNVFTQFYPVLRNPTPKSH